MRKLGLLILLCAGLLCAGLAFAQQYDVVIENGRVMDPETGLDAVRNVGILRGKISRIATDHMSGARVLDARGLVVAPGFIDLHQHGQELESQRMKALDGVTSALELEIGVPDVAEFLRTQEGHSLINYGTAASHAAVRGSRSLPRTPYTTRKGSAPAAGDRPYLENCCRYHESQRADRRSAPRERLREARGAVGGRAAERAEFAAAVKLHSGCSM